MDSRRGRSAVLSWTIAGLVAISGCAGVAGPAGSRSDAGRSDPVTVTVDLSGKTLGVLPDRYLGLSFESSSTDSAGDFKDDGNLPRLLKNLGPGVLRFGGNSVDQSSAAPSQAALAVLAKLVRQTGWNVIFSVSLGRFSAARAGQDAAEASRALGTHLTAIACGNEPDDFSRNGVRPAGFAETGYLTQARACISAIRAAVPAAGIAGPDTSHLRWLARYARAAKGSISLLTQHYYPLTDCDNADGTAFALLSRATAAAEVRRIRLAAAAARTAGVPLRISETNSASCGGIPGVSDTFASALWAVDYLVTGAEHGASGMNFHDSLTSHCNAYSPICRTGTSYYTARPIYYGLLFTHLLGTGRLLPVTTRSAANLAVHAIRSPSGTIRVVIENLAGQSQTISLRAGTSSGLATIVHLTAPSPQATSQVRIQGATLRPTGAFTPGRPGHVACHEGSCELHLAPYSAAIVTLGR
ncbi:MAG TPA: hypothetical protein VFI65_14400 [Streptosporangiaceae bacterium]|nr:hypothetical protein [Streptosporangiaceae bacterium]